MSPNRVPTDKDTLSPEPLAKGGDSIYLFIYLFIHLFIHSFMSAGIPKKEPSYIHTYIQEKKSSPSTEPHADGRPTYNGLQPARGSVTALLSLTQCHAAFGTIPSTLAWVDQSHVSQRVSQKPPSGYTLHYCYRLPRDPG